MSAIRLNPAMTFYATPSEMAIWACDWKNRYNLHFVFGRVLVNPGLLLDLDWNNNDAVGDVVEHSETLFFRLDPFYTDVSSMNQIAEKNPGCLQINLPSLSKNGLRWGALGASIKKTESARTWMEIARSLVERTANGVWFDVLGRARPTYEARVRYSQGAASLWRSGTTLLGGGRTRVVRLDAPN